MFFASLASGSSGNCTLLSTGKENILIDCGISAKRIGDSLKDLGITLHEIDAVLLTHEHIDHVKGLKRLMSGFEIPVYSSYGTFNNLANITKDEFFTFAGAQYFHPVQADVDFYIGNTLVRPFRTYHDTPGPLGYRFEMEAPVFEHDASCCVLTDCGHYDGYICSHLKNLDALLIESNHDVDMLMNGPYPMFLKRRIFSDNGHSSNASCAQLLKSIYTPKLKNVLLAHLSEENNDPETALSFVEGEVSIPELDISVAPKSGVSKVIRL